MSMSLVRLAAPILAGCALLPAQGAATLVRDINTTSPANPGSSLSLLFAGNSLLFTGNDPFRNGRELWRSDGTIAGTEVMDLNPGPSGSLDGFSEFVELAPGLILFAASESSTGNELWRTDGTVAGTMLVKDINPGREGSGPEYLVKAGGFVYFRTANTGNQLWRSDGTAAGTTLVASVNVTGTNIAALGATVFFAVSNPGIDGVELWSSNGTGAALVRDINPGSASSFPQEITAFGGFVYFRATHPSFGSELWRSDGSAAGTTLFVDAWPGTTGSQPSELTAFNGSLYFAAADSAHGRELWRGTSLFADIEPGIFSGQPEGLAVSGGNLFFAATDSAGTELWKTDGTTTSLVKDISPLGNSNPVALHDAGGTLVFFANDGTSGYEPWRSDGTAAGTYQLADVKPGSGSSGPSSMLWFAGNAYFAADDGTIGSELWRSDGVSGASLFLDLYPGASNSDPGGLVDTRGPQLALFAADDGVNGRELWRSDGSAAGTSLVKDIRAGAAASFITGPTAVSDLFGTKVYFQANDGVAGSELWGSDGTTVGTQIHDLIPGSTGSSPDQFVELGGALYFAASGNGTGVELWKLAGGVASIVKDISPGSGSSNPQFLTVVNDKVFFAATGTSGRELWVSNGTAAGTVMVTDIVAGSGSSSPEKLMRFGDKLFFRATSTGNGIEPWISDGTAAGTFMLKDINTANAFAGSQAEPLGVVGGQLLFRAFEPATGDELWATDGTTTGTLLVKDVQPGAPSGMSTLFASLGNIGVFIATDGATGYEPWRTDGTAAGTSMIADLRPGPLGSVGVVGLGSATIGWLRAVEGSNRALFAASDGISGVELWRTDGTAAGTVLHQDLAPGKANGNPAAPVQAGCLLFFAADDGVTGRELWAMPSTASSSVYGTSCPGTGGKFPHISGANGAPTIGNLAYGVRVDNAYPNSAAVALITTGRNAFPLGGGCTYYGGAVLFDRPAPTDANGTGIATLPIFPNPSYACATFYAQHFVLDPSGPFVGFTMTEGLKILINPD